MSLDELRDDIEDTHSVIESDALDAEARTELAMLLAAFDADEDDLLRRAVHLLFQTSVDMGKLDFHLRNEYGVTYDEYLAGMTFDEMAGAPQERDDERRYQF
ncbi:MAG: hypothetical protein ABEI52_10665 [Halobacteriaceae archaeon]